MHYYDPHRHEQIGWGPDTPPDAEPNDLATRICFAAARVIAFSVPIAAVVLWLWFLLSK